MSLHIEINNNLKNVAELFYSLGLEADKYESQFKNSNFLTDIAKSKLQSQYNEKVQQMNLLVDKLSLADILTIDDYLNEKYGYRS